MMQIFKKQSNDSEVDELIKERDDLKSTIKGLRKEKREVKDKLDDVLSEKKREEENLKHHVKILEEANDIEFKKKELVLEKEKEQAIAKVKDEYRDKMERRLETEVTNIKEMYSEILQRLPNVNMKITQKD